MTTDIAHRFFERADPEDVQIDSDLFRKAVDLVEEEWTAGEVPGAALVVARYGKVCAEHYYGTCCGRDGDESPYHAGVWNALYSFSKPISGSVIARAVQDGAIEYDAPISRYLPSFIGGGKDSITLRILLSHAAGIASVKYPRAYTPDEWQSALSILDQATVDWEPESRTAYHAASAMLVAVAATQAALGEPLGILSWDRICRRVLFDPLGATSLTFGVPPDGVEVALIPRPKESGAVDLTKHGPVGSPGGGCLGAIEDVLRVLQLHLNHGVWDGHPILSPQAIAEMHRPMFAERIDSDLAAGRTPAHWRWGAGWLMGGPPPDVWFGFGSYASPQAFGHAGAASLMTLADPRYDLMIVYATTASPRGGENAVRLRRNQLTNLIYESVESVIRTS